MKSITHGLVLLFTASAALAADRSYVSGNFMFALDGVNAGFVKSIDGGGVEAEVVGGAAGSTYYLEKHLGGLNFPELAVTVDAALGAALEPWIDAMLAANVMRKNGEIFSSAPGAMNQQFFHALLTGVGLPACDAASRDPAYMTLKFAPELTRYRKGGGQVQGATEQQKQKAFIPSNFRLEIAGLDCTRVNKIEAFTVKQKVIDSIGDARDYVKEPGKLEVPNLKITMAESGVTTWFDWFEKFVIQGNNDDTQEKDGRLVFLDANGKDELLEVKFLNLGIFKLVPAKSEANRDGIKRVTVELYCELMEINFKPANPL